MHCGRQFLIVNFQIVILKMYGLRLIDPFIENYKSFDTCRMPSYALSMQSLLFRYQIWRQIIFKREEESMASSLLNTIFRQNWYQCKSDYMDKAINSIFIWLVKSSFPTKTLKKWNWNLRIWIEYDLGSVLINCFFYLNWTNFGSFRS